MLALGSQMDVFMNLARIGSLEKLVSMASLIMLGLVYFLYKILPDGMPMAEIENWASAVIITIIVYMVLTTIVVHRTFVHTYLFFLFCLSLFVGGRYLAHGIGYDPVATDKSAMFGIHMPAFLVLELSPRSALELTLYIATCFLAVHAGYMLTAAFSGVPKPYDSHARSFEILKYPAMALLSVSILFFFISYPAAYRAVHSDAYSAIYKSSADFTTRGSTAAQYGLILALGLSFASGKKRLFSGVLGVLAVFYIANLALGIRGGIMSFAMLCIWLFHTQVKKIDRLALFALPLLLLGLLILGSLGSRGYYMGGESVSFLPWFLHNQGTTALTIYLSTQVDSFPTLAYFHSIFPVVPSVAALFGKVIPLDQLYFASFISKNAMSAEAYASGQGIGWSILSDFYAYTHGFPMLYLLMAFGFGAALFKLASARHPLAVGAQIMLFVKIMLLPRTGLYSIIPYSIAYVGVVAVCYTYQLCLRRRV